MTNIIHIFLSKVTQSQPGFQVVLPLPWVKAKGGLENEIGSKCAEV